MASPARSLMVLLLAGAAALSCSSDAGSPSPGIPKDVEAILFLQRVARNDGVGNVFDYTSFQPGARLVKLSPPSVDGTITNLTSDPIFQGCDIMSYDLSFDARTIVLSARVQGEQKYHLFVMNVDGTGAKAITRGSHDYVYPVFLSAQRILFMTSKPVEVGDDIKQFQDEYERQTTAQVGIINIDGSGEVLGPRNVSHRVAPAVLPDGNVLYTEWRHLGDINDGHLRLMNADMTGMREAFGGEGKGVTNSYLKARPVSSLGRTADRSMFRVVTVATDRDRTLQAGKLLLVDLNQSEKMAQVVDMTPQVPGGNGPSTMGVGRYYDAEPIGDPAENRFLVSWADGPVESELLATANTKADFGLYVFAWDGKEGKRFPLHDTPGMWDVMARPLKTRSEPPPLPSTTSGTEKSFVIGALDVYQSSIFPDLKPGEVMKARLLEGFSSEEGFPDMFGLSEFDGQSRYGEVPVYEDGSFAAKVPANVPLHIQLLDKFAMSIASEDIWVSGRAGEQRFCGGCHEDRSKATSVVPGTRRAVALGPTDLDVPRDMRQSLDYSYDKVRGVPWNLALQPILDRKCIKCHDGTAKPGNRTFTLVDATLGTSQTFTFDLRGQAMPLMVGERRMGYDYSASYVSLLGLGMELGRNMVTVQGGGEIPPAFVTPGKARESALIKKLNPPQRFPTVDPAVRAFSGPTHPAELGEAELTPDEYYLFILNIDMGGQYLFRENKSNGTPTPSPPYMP